MKKWIPVLLVLSLLLAGCSDADTLPGNDPVSPDAGSSFPALNDASGTQSAIPEPDFSAGNADMFTERDRDTAYDVTEAIIVTLQGDTASATSDSVRINGSVITLTAEKTHILSGTLNDGMIVVDADENAKLQLVLDGAHIQSSTSAPLYIREADKVFLTLADGSDNTLKNGGEFSVTDENNINAALFSKQDLTVNGSGSLTVISPAGHGISSRDDLVFTGGSITVNAASHGVDANDSVRITGTSLTLDAGKDGVHAENNDDASIGFIYIADSVLDIEAEGDGIAAGAYVQIESGTFDILAGGGSVNGTKASSDSFGGFMGGRPGRQSSTADTEADDGSTSMKGIKSGSSMRIGNGVFTIDSADDALHADLSLTIAGGSFSIASGDDALHAEDTLTVTDGTIRISESYEGLEALHIRIEGGDIALKASDDGLNAAGGSDGSGTTGGRDGMFGGGGMGGDPGMGGPGGMGGGRGGMSGNSDGSIEISGGKVFINAAGDGIDANGTLTVAGGYTTVIGPTMGDTATLDYDRSAVITGGTFIGTGASGMAQTFSGSEQGVISLSVGNQPAGTEILLTDGNGNTVLSYTPELSFAVVILSTPDMVIGEEYTITVGSASGVFAAN